MLIKKLLLTIIMICFLSSINFSNNSIGVSKFLEYYADRVSNNASVKLVYNPGLRKAQDDFNIQLILPHEKNYPNVIDSLINSGCNVIVECSELDSWHCTSEGNRFLDKIRRKGYRVVIFDGGHHLPTLGLEPDVIIMTELNGYALHGYMLDGIKISKVVDIVKELKAPIIIAQVSRWSLVKNQKSATAITEKILKQAINVKRNDNSFIPCSTIRMSKYNNTILAYVDKNYTQNFNYFINNMKDLGMTDVTKIYLAFDYRWISVEDAENFVNRVHNYTKTEVEKVNHPIKLSNSIWGGS